MLLRFDPFREADRMVDELRGRASNRAMPIDAYRRGDTFAVHLDLPGVDPDSVDIQIDKNVLTVRAERTWKDEEGDEILVTERPQGTFQRQLYLSDRLDLERLEARYEHGVLTILMPMVEQAKPRRVQVSVGRDAKAVEMTSAESVSEGSGEKRSGTGRSQPG